jgi:hypothetical protein
MAAPSAGILNILVAGGVGVAPPAASGWIIRISRFAKAPDTQIAIFDSGGGTPNPAWLYNEPTVQVMVRGAPDSYVAARQKAKDVQDALLGLPPQDINGDRWAGVTGLGDINFLQYDESDRPIFSVNFRLLLEPAVSPLTHREPL